MEIDICSAKKVSVKVPLGIFRDIEPPSDLGDCPSFSWGCPSTTEN
jgi:hypothetical protein